MRRLQITLLLIGIVVTFTGVGFLMSYWSDYSSNLGNIDTCINAGWSSNIVSGTRVEMYIVPNWFGKDDNLLEITLWGSVYTNSSTDNATFILLVPFCIRSIVNQSAIDMYSFHAQWSIQNIGSSASVVYFEVKPIPNNLSMPYFDNIDVLVDLEFTHLTAMDNHGSYTVTLPFGGGIPFSIFDKLEFNPTFAVNLNSNITFGLLLKGGLAFTSSSPEFISQGFDFGLPYHGLNQSISLLSLNYHPTLPLTITFQDSDEVNSSVQNQALAFTLLGVGIPIAISALVELIKKKTG